jgi:hypothetical protein
MMTPSILALVTLSIVVLLMVMGGHSAGFFEKLTTSSLVFLAFSFMWLSLDH